MAATKPRHFILHLLIEFRIHNAGMSIIFPHENRFIRTNPVQLISVDKSSLFNRVRGRTKTDQHLLITFLCKIRQHRKNLVITGSIHDIQSCMKCGKTRKVNMAVREGRNQYFLPKPLMTNRDISFRQFISYI